MSVALTRSPEYLGDIAGILQYFIDKNTPATALKFGKRVEKTLELLALFPEMGTPWEPKKAEIQGVRFQNVQGFRNYLIFYRPLKDRIDRVIYAARDWIRILEE